MRANDVMTDDPVTLRFTAHVADAVKLLDTLDIRHLPIVDDDGVLVGIVSDRDLRGLTIPEVLAGEYLGKIRAALDAPVSTIMSTHVISVRTETEVNEIINLMLDHKIGAVPVIDADGDLVGIVSYVDILRELPREHAEALGNAYD